MPVAPMHLNLELRGRPRRFDSLYERGKVEVVNFRDGRQRDEALQYEERVWNRAEVEDDQNLIAQTSQELHQPDAEGVSWTPELERMVRCVLHHGQALAYVGLHGQMHQGGGHKARN